LAEAYRVTHVIRASYQKVLAQNAYAASRTQQGNDFYTIKGYPWEGIFVLY
jgi:hypothetical protein